MWVKIKAFFLVIAAMASPLVLVYIAFFLIRSCVSYCNPPKEKIILDVDEVYTTPDSKIFHRIKCSKYNHNVHLTKMNGHVAVDSGYERCKDCFPDTCYYRYTYPEDYEYPDYRSDLQKGKDYVSESIGLLYEFIDDPRHGDDISLIISKLETALEYLEDVNDPDDD